MWSSLLRTHFLTVRALAKRDDAHTPVRAKKEHSRVQQQHGVYIARVRNRIAALRLYRAAVEKMDVADMLV